jgi:hypothetical protein
VDFRRRVVALGAGLVLATSGGVATAVLTAAPPAQASQVNNMMLCEPDTGWCYQTNPPYNPNFPHSCQWDYRLHNLHSGMYYTGCTAGYWGPAIH